MRWLGRGRFRFFRQQTGFTLLEVLVAVGILGFIGVGVLMALDTNSRANRTLDEQVTGINLASAHLEAIKDLPYDDTYPNAGDGITIPFQYSVDINIKYSSNYVRSGTELRRTYDSTVSIVGRHITFLEFTQNNTVVNVVITATGPGSHNGVRPSALVPICGVRRYSSEKKTGWAGFHFGFNTPGGGDVAYRPSPETHRYLSQKQPDYQLTGRIVAYGSTTEGFKPIFLPDS